MKTKNQKAQRVVRGEIRAIPRLSFSSPEPFISAHLAFLGLRWTFFPTPQPSSTTKMKFLKFSGSCH